MAKKQASSEGLVPKNRRIKCSCGHIFVAQGAKAGEKFQCAECGSLITIPGDPIDSTPIVSLVQLVAKIEPNDLNPCEIDIADLIDDKGRFVFKCSCGHRYHVDSKSGGRKAECLSCKSLFRVPRVDHEEFEEYMQDHISKAPELQFSRKDKTSVPAPLLAPDDTVSMASLDKKPASDEPQDEIEVDIDNAMRNAIEEVLEEQKRAKKHRKEK